MPNRRQFILSLAAVALAACTETKVVTDAAPGANFAAYHSFSIVGSPPPSLPEGLPFGMPGPANPVAYERIRLGVANALAAKGYAEATPGDLSVVISLGSRERANFYSWGPLNGQMDVHQYTEGELAVDVFDSATRRPVWHGRASRTIDPDKAEPEVISAAVASVMQGFPGR